MPLKYNSEPLYGEMPSLSSLDAINAIRAKGNERIAGVLENIHDAVNQLSTRLRGAVGGRFEQIYVEDADSGELIGAIGSFETAQGLTNGAHFTRLWVAGDIGDPDTAPFYVDNAGKLWFILGDTDDAAALEVLDAGGNRVLWAGKDGSNHGLAVANLWVGPDADPATAPFFCDGSNVVIGENGAVYVRNTRGVDKGFLGIVLDGSPKAITAVANNGSGLIRVTVTGHGWETGDTVDATMPGVGTGSFSGGVTRIDANTFDFIGSTFSGAYSGGGTASRYFGGAWVETFAAGNTGFGDALFRVLADSTLRIGIAGQPNFTVQSDGTLVIGEATGARFVVNPDGTVEMVDATFSLELNGARTTIANEVAGSTTSGVIVENIAGGYESRVTPEGVDLVDGGGVLRARLGYAEGLLLKNSSDVLTAEIDSDGVALVQSLTLGTTPLSVGQGGTSARNAADARTNLDVYSKAEIAALLLNYATTAALTAGLAGKSNTGHTHTLPANTGGGGSPSHTHALGGSTGPA